MKKEKYKKKIHDRWYKQKQVTENIALEIVACICICFIDIDY